MFKIGDIVTIKQLSACDKSCAIFNSIAMTKYQGTSGYITHINRNTTHIGFKTQKRDLSYTNEYAGVEGTIINVYDGDIIELEFEDGEKNFYFSHWLKPQTEYNAF